MAAALYNDIYIIHIAGDASGRTPATEHVISQSNGVTEHIVYYNKPSSAWKRVTGQYNWVQLFRKTVLDYMRENGKPDFVHVQVPVKAGIAALWIKRKFRIPYVVTEHAGIYNRVVVDPYEDRSFFFRYFTRKIIQRADKFLPVSNQIGEAINKMVIQKPYTVIPNTVDTSHFFYRPATVKKFRFIHVSNMIPLKNVEGIINAVDKLWQQRQDFEVQITGAISPIVLKHAEQSGSLNKAFFFTGEIPYVQVAEEMKAAHSVLLFSRTENMPCVVLESLCCGRPVIVTRVGGIPEVVNDANGILVESDNEAELVNAMQKMIDHYTSFNQVQIAAAACGLYSYEAIGQQINMAYS